MAKNLSFTRLVQAWEESGTGQIMVQRVDVDAVENYGIADLNGEVITPFSSVEVKGLIEKRSPSKAPLNLAIGIRDPETRRVIKKLFDDSDVQAPIKSIIELLKDEYLEAIKE